MRIAVMVKQVPDTDMIRFNEDGTMDRSSAPAVLDPFGFFALDMALRIRKEQGSTVTAVTMGPVKAEEALMTCLEHGADDAVLLNDKSFAGSDTYATAKVLSAFLSGDGEWDLVFCGMQATDGDTAQVPAELAEMLGYGLISYVHDYRDGMYHQSYGDDHFITKAVGPTVISVSRGPLPAERIPKTSDFISARSKNIRKIDRVAVGLGAFSTGTRGSKTRVVKTESIHRQAIDGVDHVDIGPEEAATLLIEEVKDERR